MKKLIAFFGIAALASCGPVDVLNTVTPSGSYSLAEDIKYGEHPRLRLDVYKPDEEREDSPVIIYVHGGGWNDGSKGDYKFLGENFATNGYRVVVPNYRLHPDIIFPDPITDTAMVTRWATDEYPGRKIVLMGHSAGGYNVLMAGLVPEYLEDEGVNRCERVAGIISLAAPTGIIPLKKEPYITIFPDRFTGLDAPLNNTNEASPPLLLLHGQADKTVFPENQERLAEKVNARGGNAKVIVYQKVDHIEIVQYLSRYFDGDGNVKDDILDFLENIDLSADNYCR